MVHPNSRHRQRLACELVGDGIEIGPGCHPLPLGPAARSIRYIDQFTRESFFDTFPECRPEIDGFPREVTQANINQVDLENLVQEPVDFVVLNHVLEHLADPIRLLKQVHRQLVVGGILYLAVPDKRFMFDRYRRRTTLRELIDRNARGLVEPTDEMIVDFIHEAERPPVPIDLSKPQDVARVADHRKRSIHANVWVVEDVLELFEYLSSIEGTSWDLMDGMVTTTEVTLLFRKSTDERSHAKWDRVMSRIWFDSQQARLDPDDNASMGELRHWTLDIHRRLLRLDERVREGQNVLRRIKRSLQRFPWVGRWLSRPEGEATRSGAA